tara:strand:- start:75 stop:464 length:390 start_codon:yes stop_codon:yes gene_type:complete
LCQLPILLGQLLFQQDIVKVQQAALQGVLVMLPLEIQRIPLHGPTLILQQVLEVGAQVIQPLGAQPTQLLDPPASQLAEVRLSLITGIHHLQPPGLTQRTLLIQNQETELLIIKLADGLKRIIMVVGFV